MATQRETIVLDPATYNLNTHKWDVPIFRLPSVKCVSLHINKQEIPSNKYSVNKNFLAISEEYDIDENTTGHLIVEIAPTNVLVKFWLPIILAVIGLIAAIGQPVLHNFGLLYTPELCYSVNPISWSYDQNDHKFNLRLALQPIRKEGAVKESELDKWRLFLCVREKDKTVDYCEYKYEYVGGPFSLNTIMEHSIKTNKPFTNKLNESKTSAQCAIVLVHKSVAIGDCFSPSEYGNDVVRVRGAVSLSLE